MAASDNPAIQGLERAFKVKQSAPAAPAGDPNSIFGGSIAPAAPNPNSILNAPQRQPAAMAPSPSDVEAQKLAIMKMKADAAKAQWMAENGVDENGVAVKPALNPNSVF